MPNLVDTAANAGSFNTLVTAIEAAGLLEILTSPGPYTVLAPTDEAFAKIPVDTLSGWLQDIPKLKKILTFHVLFGDVRTDNFVELDSAETFEGGIIGIERADNGFEINGAKVLQTDILADNGVIHTIDTVLIPTFL
ncbi:MAG TPA: fasciclin domain-containing protein [Oculatellaceae cyanobacterium]|jgi:uncharacterized surface protein with fasciclin (FAS1) repeats